MRDRYLYRAKRTDNGEWVEGYYTVARDRKGLQQHNILVADNDLGYFKWNVVDQSTICQCTGLKDKNGKLIWENDIVKIDRDVYMCFWNESNFEWGFKNNEEDFGVAYVCSNEIEVIGSTIDNPKLLER